MKRRIVSVLTVLALLLMPETALAAGTTDNKLDLSNQTSEKGGVSDTYHWMPATATDGSNDIISGTLTLKEGFTSTEVTLPDATVKIITEGTVTIDTLSPHKDTSGNIDPNNTKLTLSGAGTLIIKERLSLSNGANNSLTVDAGAHVVAEKGIEGGSSGGIEFPVTVDGKLEVKDGNPAISAGKLVVGNSGSLDVSGTAGVCLNGMGNTPEDFYNLFSVTGDGSFTAHCTEYNVRVPSGNENGFPEGTDVGKVIQLSKDYLPSDCKVEQKTFGTIDFINTDSDEVYTGSMTIHQNHNWSDGDDWAHDEEQHWRYCKFESCNKTKDEAQHTKTNGTIKPKSGTDKTPIRTTKCPFCAYEITEDSNKITVGSFEHGEITIDPTYKDSTIEDSTIDRTYAFSGDTVTLTVKPDDGYMLTADAINIVPASRSGNTPDVKQVGDNKYTFTMPDGPVTVTATFKEKGPDNPGSDDTPGGSSGGGGGSSGSYTIKIEKPEHGEVTSDRRYTDQGELVRLTVKPDSGYRLTGLTVTDGRGNEIAVTEEADGTFTFTMPNSSVTVRASFGPDGPSGCGGGIDCPSRAYRDLDTSQWYHLAVDYVLRNGLMSGYGNQTFGPNDPLTRAQFAQILYNQAGRPAVTGSSPFTDVDPGEWFAPAVSWAAERGVVNGYGNGLFGPNDPITREQLAAMLWRYSDCPEPTISQLDFTDAAKISPYALEPLRWAVELHVVNGLGNRVLDPQGLASRAQIAQMLLNLFGR